MLTGSHTVTQTRCWLYFFFRIIIAPGSYLLTYISSQKKGYQPQFPFRLALLWGAAELAPRFRSPELPIDADSLPPPCPSALLASCGQTLACVPLHALQPLLRGKQPHISGVVKRRKLRACPVTAAWRKAGPQPSGQQSMNRSSIRHRGILGDGSHFRSRPSRRRRSWCRLCGRRGRTEGGADVLKWPQRRLGLAGIRSLHF
jgi:hypothetical protein